MKKLFLKQHQVAEERFRYEVIQVVNQTTPRIGSLLSESETDLFCEDPTWNVTIKPE